MRRARPEEIMLILGGDPLSRDLVVARRAPYGGVDWEVTSPGQLCLASSIENAAAKMTNFFFVRQMRFFAACLEEVFPEHPGLAPFVYKPTEAAP